MILANIYKIIADLINDAQSRGDEIVSYIEDMNTVLSNSGILSSSIHRQKLESQIDVTSKVMINRHQVYITQMMNFVLVLQKFIEDNYSPINDFLFNNSIKVFSTFANISEIVGYPIDDVNIEDVS